MIHHITDTMDAALIRLRDMGGIGRTAQELQQRLTTLYALHERGLVNCIDVPGNVPRSCKRWGLTDAGRGYLQAIDRAAATWHDIGHTTEVAPDARGAVLLPHEINVPASVTWPVAVLVCSALGALLGHVLVWACS